jgi:hypothetical protein
MALRCVPSYEMSCEADGLEADPQGRLDHRRALHRDSNWRRTAGSRTTTSGQHRIRGKCRLLGHRQTLRDVTELHRSIAMRFSI